MLENLPGICKTLGFIPRRKEEMEERAHRVEGGERVEMYVLCKNEMK